MANEPVMAISRRKPRDLGKLRSSVECSLLPTTLPSKPEITDRQVVGWPMVNESSPVTCFTKGRIRLGDTTMYRAVKMAARMMSFPPVRPASTPAAMKTNGNQ